MVAEIKTVLEQIGTRLRRDANVEIPYSRWYSSVEKRRSRRQFDPTRPIQSDLLAALGTFCTEFRPFPHARAKLVTELPDRVFKGAIGPYGRIKDAPAFVAFIGNIGSPYVQEEVGYTGEGIILEATALQLDTCWVAGFFRPELAASLAGAGGNERVLAVTPLGYAKESQSMQEKLMTGFGRTHKRKLLSSLVAGLEESEWSEWMRAALEAGRQAPSAVNRQPWRFLIQKDSITISLDRLGRDFGISKRLDCGIAMLHIEVVALNFGVQGKWELLESPQVARFIIRPKEKRASASW